MPIKLTLASVLLSLVACGCGGPGAGPQADVDHWLSKVPAGSTDEDAQKVLADNDFSNWSTGRVIYGYRDAVASCDYSNGIGMQIHTDAAGHVTSSEAVSSAVSPYPMLDPTYP